MAALTPQRNMLAVAEKAFQGMNGQLVDVVDVNLPYDPVYAIHLGKGVSKLSRLVGNMLEYKAARHLNEIGDWSHKENRFDKTRHFLG